MTDCPSCADCGDPANYLCTVCYELYCRPNGCPMSGNHHACIEITLLLEEE